MKIGILEPADFSENALDVLKTHGEVSCFLNGTVESFIRDKEVLFVRLAHQLNADCLSNAQNLKVICSPTTGLNHIDLAYCEKYDIRIISLKGETQFLKTIRATPEHTLGLIIALRRHYQRAFLSIDNPIWDREPYKGYEIYNSKIGIIGLGRVGHIVADYLLQMGANVGFYDCNDSVRHEKALQFENNSKLIQWADTIILCASYNAEQGIIIDSKLIDLMKNKYFINTARAELTDESHLSIRALEGFFKGLAVDVVLDEQNSRENLNKLLEAVKKHNVIVTPHIGGATFSSMARTEEFIVSKWINSIEI